MNSLSFFISSVLLLQGISVISTTFQCRDQNNKEIDWFIIYKLPKIRHENGTPFGEGLAFFYMDAKNMKWTLSPKAINESNHAVFYTLQQVYTDQSQNIMYLMYNDETPSGRQSLNHGHTKGTLGFDHISGFWLIHSAPQFPPNKKSGYSWADNASDYGQTFLCMSFSYKSLNVLATQLYYNYPQFYDNNIPEPFKVAFPLLQKVINSTRITSPPYCSIQRILSSLGGMPLTSFAKFSDFDSDLYDDLVAPNLKTPLLVETWQHAASSIILPSNCSVQYKVYNILEVIMPGNYFFWNNKDHSKFAFSLSSGYWVCIGDINRDSTQFKRAGGTLCFENQQVWEAFYKSVTYFSPCPDHFYDTSLRFAPQCLNSPLA